MKKDFITGAEYPLAVLQQMVTTALAYKKTGAVPNHAGKILTLLFANPSLRTHLSFESGMKKMGGDVNVLHTGNSWQFEYQDGVVMDGNKQEHIKEAARVISRYTDIIGLRQSDLITTAQSHSGTTDWATLKQDLPITQLARYAEKPVINMESNMFHPCQSMADMMTMQEAFGSVQKKKYVLTWAPHPKALPLATPHSQFLTPAIFGMDVTLAYPEGFELDADVIALAKEKATESGGSVQISHNQTEAFQNADVIMAKSWASLEHFGKWEQESAYRKQFAHWTVNKEKMQKTNNAIFMHCLPVRRNVVVTDGVLDSPSARIIDEAENRMWAQMAILSYLLS